MLTGIGNLDAIPKIPRIWAFWSQLIFLENLSLINQSSTSLVCSSSTLSRLIHIPRPMRSFCFLWRQDRFLATSWFLSHRRLAFKNVLPVTKGIENDVEGVYAWTSQTLGKVVTLVYKLEIRCSDRNTLGWKPPIRCHEGVSLKWHLKHSTYAGS